MRNTSKPTDGLARACGKDDFERLHGCSNMSDGSQGPGATGGRLSHANSTCEEGLPSPTAPMPPRGASRAAATPLAAHHGQRASDPQPLTRLRAYRHTNKLACRMKCLPSHPHAPARTPARLQATPARHSHRYAIPARSTCMRAATPTLPSVSSASTRWDAARPAARALHIALLSQCSSGRFAAPCSAPRTQSCRPPGRIVSGTPCHM